MPAPSVLAVNKFHYRLGGVETYHLGLIALLEGRGHPVAAFAMQHPRNELSPWAPYFVSAVDYADARPWARLRAAARALYSLEARRRLGALLRAFRPDVAHLQHIYRQLSPAVLDALAAHGVPVVQTVHDYWMVCPNRRMFLTRREEMCYRCQGGRFYHALAQGCIYNGRLTSALGMLEAYLARWSRIYHKRVHTFIAPSRFLAERLREAEVDPARIIALPYFIEAGWFSTEPDAGEGVLFVGRLEVEKGVHVLLRAARALPTILFRIAGQGADEAQLRRQAAALPNVSFLGPLSPSEVRQAMRQARIIVVPSIWHDVAPLVVLEAFASGKPVVASAVGGLPELVREGETGRLVPPNDPEALAAAIAALYASPARAAEMGRAARRYAERHHDPERHYQALLAIYAAARAGGPPPNLAGLLAD